MDVVEQVHRDRRQPPRLLPGAARRPGARRPRRHPAAPALRPGSGSAPVGCGADSESEALTPAGRGEHQPGHQPRRAPGRSSRAVRGGVGPLAAGDAAQGAARSGGLRTRPASRRLRPSGRRWPGNALPNQSAARPQSHAHRKRRAGAGHVIPARSVVRPVARRVADRLAAGRAGCAHRQDHLPADVPRL
jgi:hypothetical protein